MTTFHEFMRERNLAHVMIAMQIFSKKTYLNEHISSNHENKKKMQSVPLTDARFQMVIENWEFMMIPIEMYILWHYLFW